MTQAHVVFISHSSEDKHRFVIPFATKLREKGIAAWVDQWEILPGDSLVQKLFADGLQPASAVIVVLSSASIASRWVQEEINYAFVKRVTEGSKLIPVLIDDVVVPPELQSTCWHRVKDLSNIDDDVARILDAIAGRTSGPSVGSLPGYIARLRPLNVTAADWFVLDLGAQRRMLDRTGLINVEDFLAAAGAAGLSSEDALDAVEILDGRGLVKNRTAIGLRVVAYQVTTAGFGKWLQETNDDHDSLYDSVCRALINLPQRWAHEVAAALRQPEAIVDYVFEDLEQQGLVRLRKTLGNRSAFVAIVGPELKRRLQ